jgi:hypothetical protein
MQHPHDEDLELQEVHPCLEIKPLRTWYYHIYLNSNTLVILLQVDPVSGDELESIYEGCFKSKNTFIFAWSSIPGVGHYRWLYNLIHQLPFNSKGTT